METLNHDQRYLSCLNGARFSSLDGKPVLLVTALPEHFCSLDGFDVFLQKTSSAFEESTLQELLDDPESTLLSLFFDEGRPCLMGALLLRIYEPRAVEVGLYLSPAFRGSGIGKASLIF